MIKTINRGALQSSVGAAVVQGWVHTELRHGPSGLVHWWLSFPCLILAWYPTIKLLCNAAIYYCYCDKKSHVPMHALKHCWCELSRLLVSS
jgi:hypothetical protein